MVVAISSDRSGPMKIIKISDATNRAIAETAIYPFHSTARRLPDETDDDTILRALHVHSGWPNN